MQITLSMCSAAAPAFSLRNVLHSLHLRAEPPRTFQLRWLPWVWYSVPGIFPLSV